MRTIAAREENGFSVLDLPVRPVAAPLRRHIEDFLRRSIISGRFAPGERLREREILELLKVSRTSYREALRQIEAEGLVVLSPNKGPVVNTLSYEEAEELYEARSVLEAQACSGFAERATNAQIEELRAVYRKLAEAVRAGALSTALELKSEFYAIILAGCGNRFVTQLLLQIHNRVMLLRRTSISDPSRAPEMLHEIGTLVDALTAHDSRAAWTVSVHHVRQARRTALKLMRQAEWQLGRRSKGKASA